MAQSIDDIQRKWSMPRQCWTDGCTNSIENDYVTITYPCIEDCFVDGRSFAKGTVIRLCNTCGLKLYKLMFKYLSEGKGR